ncbi:MAG: hypothetical protein HY559_03830 [Gammaproteobacteria bacterium]|nr:hypothetical protein [Gammaproteobacteria bacterium]
MAIIRTYHELLEYVQAQGRKTFSLQEVIQIKEGNRNAASLMLQDMVSHKFVKPIAKGFYAIYSSSEKQTESISCHDYIDQLMQHKKVQYYVGLLSAASVYGATHHRPMIYQVVTNQQVRIPKKLLPDIHFFTKKHFPTHCVLKRKGQYGYMNFSTPALTLYDAIKFEKSCGTLYNVILIFKEILPELKLLDVRELVKNSIEVSVIQKFGYLLEKLGQVNLAKYFKPMAAAAKSYVPLSKYDSNKRFEKNGVWKVIDNIDWGEVEDVA